MVEIAKEVWIGFVIRGITVMLITMAAVPIK